VIKYTKMTVHEMRWDDDNTSKLGVTWCTHMQTLLTLQTQKY